MPTHSDIDGYLAALAPATRRIGEELRATIDRSLPSATGTIWHGQPVWMSAKQPLAGFKAYTGYVTFMIWNGNPIPDATGRLQPGSRMATLKLHAPSDIDRTAFTAWLQAAHGA